MKSRLIVFKKYNVICGHYGSGKTNFAVNAAFNLRETGSTVTIVDLDVVNPYFRTSDYTEDLLAKGIRVISPNTARTNVDAPALSGEIYSVFDNADGYIIFDVGGDDAGAYTLGRFSEKIISTEDYQGIFVVNMYRTFIANPKDALEIMREIENAGHIPMTGLVNNSNLSILTDEETILASMNYSKEISRISGLPLLANTVPKDLVDSLSNSIDNIYPVEVYVKLPWN